MQISRRTGSSPLARLVVAAAAAAAVAALAAPEAAAEIGVGDRAAEFVAVKDARGRKLRLKGYRGKVVVVTFGASWCKPCKKELPAWDKLAARYADKGVVFVAVNIDKDTAKGKEFMAEARLSSMRAGFEPSGATAASYEPPTMPTTYVIDKRGVVRLRHRGYRAGDEKQLAAGLDELLGK